MLGACINTHGTDYLGCGRNDLYGTCLAQQSQGCYWSETLCGGGRCDACFNCTVITSQTSCDGTIDSGCKWDTATARCRIRACSEFTTERTCHSREDCTFARDGRGCMDARVACAVATTEGTCAANGAVVGCAWASGACKACRDVGVVGCQATQACSLRARRSYGTTCQRRTYDGCDYLNQASCELLSPTGHCYYDAALSYCGNCSALYTMTECGTTQCSALIERATCTATNPPYCSIWKTQAECHGRLTLDQFVCAWNGTACTICPELNATTCAASPQCVLRTTDNTCYDGRQVCMRNGCRNAIYNGVGCYIHRLTERDGQCS
ncbi:MAG: hypothetical protein Q8J97_01320, partial [Flavobacteriaceae bacterium]|nr:hypothetical protein [Flavobacteriaceae bacterium]